MEIHRQSILTATVNRKPTLLQRISSYRRVVVCKGLAVMIEVVSVKLDNSDVSTKGLQKSSEASQLPTLLENVSLEFLNRSVLMSLISVLINIL